MTIATTRMRANGVLESDFEKVPPPSPLCGLDCGDTIRPWAVYAPSDSVAARVLVLNDASLIKAVADILLRSEREPDPESLERTYVDTGVLPQLDNANNQVLYGRRGTGKSHVLRVLGHRKRRDKHDLAVYVDMRLLGSALSMADPTRPVATRCVNVFKDLLIEIRRALVAASTDAGRPVRGDGMEKLEEFTQVITDVARISNSMQVSSEVSSSTSVTAETRAGLAGAKPSISAETSSGATDGQRLSEAYTEVFENNLVFSDVFHHLDAALEALGIANLFVLLDEWAGVPMELQPLLAEFLKHSLMPSSRVTLKIASLEYRSRLSSPLDNNRVIGFEVGGDISAIFDLDDYLVYDRNPTQVEETFEQLLYKHVEEELPTGYLEKSGVKSAADFRRRIFSERETFVELVRASEGVVRDFISIFNAAFFGAQRRGRSNIDVKAVREAARMWYETDKSVNLTPDQHAVLDRIITEVIGKKRSRSFLLQRDLGRHPVIQGLFDFRVLHLMTKGYSDKDNPGVRYNIYNLDYGTYVDLIQTKKQPTLGLLDDMTEDAVVPFDDKRSIRRIVVDPSVLGGGRPPVE